MPIDTFMEAQRRDKESHAKWQRLADQRKKEAAEEVAETRRKLEEYEREQAKKSEEHRNLESFIYRSNIEGEKATAFYGLIKWAGILEEKIKTLEETLDAKVKELEKRIEYL